MKYLLTLYKYLPGLAVCAILLTACSKMLDTKVYSIVENSNYWKTPEQIKAGVAPAYNALRMLSITNTTRMLNNVSSDEMIVPTRGTDWGSGGIYIQEWLHTWTATHPNINNLWDGIFNGIGNINFISSIVNDLPEKPADIDAINAELNTMRAYYYYLALDNFGNVPIVRDFNTDPNTIKNNSRQEVYDFVEQELLNNIDGLPATVDGTTYGRATKWMAHATLAKLYLNAEVYTGTQEWEKCIEQCDFIINSGNYSLSANYFDNFSGNNESSKENIFSVPLDAVYTDAIEWQWPTLHYQNTVNFQLPYSPWNGDCSTGEYYFANFDTTSEYVKRGSIVYRTFLDSRTGQYLIGQQFAIPFSYPPNKDVVFDTDDESLKLKDIATGLFLSFDPDVFATSHPSGKFRIVGLRNIKYFPAANAIGQSNDFVIFRLADILLMKAEAQVRLNIDPSGSLDLVNAVRERAYGNPDHNWLLPDLTLDNILAERARELSWECYRRQDLIRYEVAVNGQKRYFSAARSPEKGIDPDNHYRIFPIPQAKIIANSNLNQNPGYQ